MAHSGLGSIPGPGVTCGLSLLLVLVLAQRIQVSLSHQVFLPPQKKKKTNKQAKNKKTIQIRPGSRGKKNHLVEWPLLNSRSLPIIPVVFRVVCTNSASSSIQMVERRATILPVSSGYSS